MRVETKQVFYCDFCKGRKLSRLAMEKHELHCTMNPERTCRWWISGDHGDHDRVRKLIPTHPYYGKDGQPPHAMPRGLARWVRMFGPRHTADWSRDDTFIRQLREHALGCPACMLSAIRQSGVDRTCLYDGDHIWDYDLEVKRYREEEHEFWEHEERRAIEATLL